MLGCRVGREWHLNQICGGQVAVGVANFMENRIKIPEGFDAQEEWGRILVHPVLSCYAIYFPDAPRYLK